MNPKDTSIDPLQVFDSMLIIKSNPFTQWILTAKKSKDFTGPTKKEQKKKQTKV